MLTHQRRWLRRGLATATPLLAGCGPGGTDCGKEVTVPWDAGFPDGGVIADPSVCAASCGAEFNRCSVTSGSGSQLLLDCRHVCIGGRAPPGLVQLSAIDDTAGSWLSRLAELESAAVQAFSQLSDELERHGLSDAAAHALTAASDEVRHAQLATRLALARGWCPKPLALHPTAPRSLEEVALDNAAEGCGRELFGAAVNFHQARTAEDRDVATAMAAIAADEHAHAGFSFALAEALMPRLNAAQRRRVREAQELALLRLGGETVSDGARAGLGLLHAADSARLARGLLETNRL